MGFVCPSGGQKGCKVVGYLVHLFGQGNVVHLRVGWAQSGGWVGRHGLGMRMWHSMTVVSGSGSGCAPWWWGSRWWGQDGGCTFMFGVQEQEGSISGWGQERWHMPKSQVAVLKTDVELVGLRAGWAQLSGWQTQPPVLCGDEL